MDWNNGTIFRVFVNVSDNVGVGDNNLGVPEEIDCKVDISQQELSGNVLMGIENFVVKPRVEFASDPATQTLLQDYWAKKRYLQFESYQLAPYIDFSSQNDTQSNQIVAQELNSANSRNTQIFGRIPLIATPSLGNSNQITEATFAGDRVLNKDSILYEMRNNPLALQNGRLRFRILDETGAPIKRISLAGQVDKSYLLSISFTLVIYKPKDNYT